MDKFWDMLKQGAYTSIELEKDALSVVLLCAYASALVRVSSRPVKSCKNCGPTLAGRQCHLPTYSAEVFVLQGFIMF